MKTYTNQLMNYSSLWFLVKRKRGVSALRKYSCVIADALGEYSFSFPVSIAKEIAPTEPELVFDQLVKLRFAEFKLRPGGRAAGG